MSCDNLEANGDAARAAPVAVAELRHTALAEWIASNVAFPSSMVDRTYEFRRHREGVAAASEPPERDPVPTPDQGCARRATASVPIARQRRPA